MAQIGASKVRIMTNGTQRNENDKHAWHMNSMMMIIYDAFI